MQSARSTAIVEARRLVEEARQLRRQLRSCEAAYRRSLRELERGTAMHTIMGTLGVGHVREVLTESLDHFEQARHRSRIASIALGLEEGMTVGDLGRSWGFSRQLASRYAKEARMEA
jgi:hypothetical protein